MVSDYHETLVYRLAQMLVKLNQGEKLDPRALAGEFGVNLRTIQRDLNSRFAYLPLQKTDGRYHLDPVFLGKLSTRDIDRFAGLAGVRGLFPPLTDDFLRDIFDARIHLPCWSRATITRTWPARNRRSGSWSRPSSPAGTLRSIMRRTNPPSPTQRSPLSS
jgi:predicted DNA-binding transcriptional regulator YafY